MESPCFGGFEAPFVRSGLRPVLFCLFFCRLPLLGCKRNKWKQPSHGLSALVSSSGEQTPAPKLHHYHGLITRSNAIVITYANGTFIKLNAAFSPAFKEELIPVLTPI